MYYPKALLLNVIDIITSTPNTRSMKTILDDSIWFPTRQLGVMYFAILADDIDSFSDPDARLENVKHRENHKPINGDWDHALAVILENPPFYDAAIHGPMIDYFHERPNHDWHQGLLLLIKAMILGETDMFIEILRGVSDGRKMTCCHYAIVNRAIDNGDLDTIIKTGVTLHKNRVVHERDIWIF